jgi:hypothetical protein
VSSQLRPWQKQGLIFTSEQNHPWMHAYASVPTVTELNDKTLRVFVGTRDQSNRSFTGFIDLNRNQPKQILRISESPVLNPGPIGAFDDCGAMPSWVVRHQNDWYLYYIGWNVRNTVPYHNSIGLAISRDGGNTFQKHAAGPVLDRSITDPYFVSNPCVLVDQGVWKMWYISCFKWDSTGGLPEAFYHVKYAESLDGMHWKAMNHVCIPLRGDETAIARPCVIKEKHKYRMWYSYRRRGDYRSKSEASYRIGYAESLNGLDWRRLDELAMIEISNEGWDSKMIEYPFYYRDRDIEFLFYNGNTFGRTGFGFAQRVARET